MTGSRRLVILAHWSPHGSVEPYVQVHLEALRDIADRLVLVSNSPLDPAARQAMTGLCDHVIERENRGWDFGAWRDALARERMDHWDHVILTNSSVIGPLHPLQQILEKMEGQNLDYWGLIQSRELLTHFQSFFLSFSKTVTGSSTWRDFWREVPDTNWKNRVIFSGEIGLSRCLQAAGFFSKPWLAFEPFPKSIRLVPAVIKPFRGWLYYPFDVNFCNRSLILHQEILGCGFPYLKASLVWGGNRHLLGPMERVKLLSATDFPWERIGL
jgi:lipopolysaccharide biosynthesis protein